MTEQSPAASHERPSQAGQKIMDQRSSIGSGPAILQMTVRKCEMMQKHRCIPSSEMLHCTLVADQGSNS